MVDVEPELVDAYSTLTCVRRLPLAHQERDICLTLGQFIKTELKAGEGTPAYRRWLREREMAACRT